MKNKYIAPRCTIIELEVEDCCLIPESSRLSRQSFDIEIDDYPETSDGWGSFTGSGYSSDDDGWGN